MNYKLWIEWKLENDINNVCMDMILLLCSLSNPNIYIYMYIYFSIETIYYIMYIEEDIIPLYLAIRYLLDIVYIRNKEKC